MKHTDSNACNIGQTDMETRIAKVARELFIKKGFAETSMSEIAEAVGINRPTLHYYYNTKDKMFRAVFGEIVETILPKVQDIMAQRELPISERISRVADTYYGILLDTPGLPLFVVRELNRDNKIFESYMDFTVTVEAVKKLAICLHADMDEGKIRRLPLHIIFFTFYGLLLFPFFSYKAVGVISKEDDILLSNIIAEWKPYMVEELTHLLQP